MITEKNAFITKVAIHLGSSIRRRLAVRRNPSAWALSRSTVSVGVVLGLAVTVMSINQLLGVDDAEDDRGDRDRKSTRLNSSHVAISYAVFCLKKKIKLQD